MRDLDVYFRIFDSPENNQTLDIRADGSGFIVLWYGEQTGDRDVYVTIFDSGGQKQTGDTRLNSYTTDSQSASAVCCAQGGFVVAVWSSYGQDGDEYGVYFKIGGFVLRGKLRSTHSLVHASHPAPVHRPLNTLSGEYPVRRRTPRSRSLLVAQTKNVKEDNTAIHPSPFFFSTSP
ncbi:MAG: hypothetical protein ACTSUQ_11830 [Candidatus Freyarchaeota archaeon]